MARRGSELTPDQDQDRKDRSAFLRQIIGGIVVAGLIGAYVSWMTIRSTADAAARDVPRIEKSMDTMRVQMDAMRVQSYQHEQAERGERERLAEQMRMDQTRTRTEVLQAIESVRADIRRADRN